MTLGWTSAFGGSSQSACLSRNSPAYTGVSTPPTKDHRCQSVSTQTENQDGLHSGSANLESPRSYHCPYRGFYAGSPTIPPIRQHCKQSRGSPHLFHFLPARPGSLQQRTTHTTHQRPPPWGPINKLPVTLGANPSSALLIHTPMTDQSLRDS